MEDLNSRDWLLNRVWDLWKVFAGVIAQVGDERNAQSESFGEWSSKDLIAHLTG